MRVRWSQLVYRRPGSDNEVGLARVCQTMVGEVMRFGEGNENPGDFAKGYLALVPLARGMEEELDEWVEIDPEMFLERNRSLWRENREPVEKVGFLRALADSIVNAVRGPRWEGV